MGRQQPAASLLLTAGISNDFLLVPAQDAFSTEGSPELAPSAVPPALPVVWQSFFASRDKLSSTEYMAKLTCSSALGEASAAAEPPQMGPSSIFSAYLSPEALVRRHRLGLPEIQRIYQAMQVYSVGFHQALSEATCHALDRGQLLLTVWRGFAMLWDGALQVVFPSETVKLNREQQAAVLSVEHAMAVLQECQAGKEALVAENTLMRTRMEDVVAEMLSVKADATVLHHSAQAAKAEAKELRKEAKEAARALSEIKAENRLLQVRLTELSSPELAAKVERLGRQLAEREETLKDSSKQEAALKLERDAAQNLARAERMKREEAVARARQLEEQLEDLSLKLRALQSQHAAAQTALGDRQALADRVALLQGADSKFEAWQARALEAEARAATLEEELKGERAKSEQLVESYWPLAAKLKTLEAQLGEQGGGGKGVG